MSCFDKGTESIENERTLPRWYGARWTILGNAHRTMGYSQAVKARDFDSRTPGSIPGSLVGAEPPHRTHFHVKSSSPTSGKLSKDRHKVRWALGFVAVVTLSAEKESQQAAR